MASSIKDVTFNQYFSEGEKTTHTKFKREVVLEKEMGTSPDFKWKIYSFHLQGNKKAVTINLKPLRM